MGKAFQPIRQRRTNYESKNARRLWPPRYERLMRQAQKMQEDMKSKQAELEAAEYTGSAPVKWSP